MKINQKLILQLSGIFIVLGMLFGGIGFFLSGCSLEAYQTGSQKWYRTFQVGSTTSKKDIEYELQQELEELKEEQADLKHHNYDEDVKEEIKDIQEEIDHVKNELQELR